MFHSSKSITKMKTTNDLDARVRQFFASECTLSEMMAEVSEATSTLYEAVCWHEGTTKAICAVDLLYNVSKLLDILGEYIED